MTDDHDRLAASSSDSEEGVRESEGNRRRRLLSVIASAGAGCTLLPTHWSKPVVEQVLLPAHAQTTDQEDDEIDLRNCVVTGEWNLASYSSGSFINTGVVQSSTFVTTTGAGTGTSSSTYVVTDFEISPEGIISAYLPLIFSVTGVPFSTSASTSFSSAGETGGAGGDYTFTYAAVTGTDTAIQTSNGFPGALSWTVAISQVATDEYAYEQTVEWEFDSTCFD